MPINVLRDIRRIYAGLNADEIRGAAYQNLNVGLMAASEDAYQEMEQFLAPAWLGDTTRAEALKAMHRVNWAPVSHFDFVLCAPGLPLPPNGYEFKPADTDAVARAIL